MFVNPSRATAFFAAIALSITLNFTPPMVKTASAERSIPVYTPKVSGAPTRRVGGGTRGFGQGGTTLAVLAPMHTGETINPQPALYWAVSGAADKPFMFTLIHAEADISVPESIEPLLEMRIHNPVDGVQALELASQNVNLEPGVEYEWSLSISPDPDNRSNDIVSSGTIILVEPDAGLQAKLDAADEKERPFIYAAEGLWYDAISSLSRLIDKYPEDKTLHEQRAALLEQVGLEEVAKFDLDLKNS